MTQISRRELLEGAGALALGLIATKSQALTQERESGIEELLTQHFTENPNSPDFTDPNLRNPRLSFEKPDVHYVNPAIRENDLYDMKIGVDTATRNVYVFRNDNEVLFRAPTILGKRGENETGTYYASSFSKEGVIWVPSNNRSKRVVGVFGNLWVPLQDNSVAIDSFSGGWAPVGYYPEFLAIHGTNENEAFESTHTFKNTTSLGCSRLYKDAVPYFREILELSARGELKDISSSARGKNPTGNTYALNRAIPVIIGPNLI